MFARRLRWRANGAASESRLLSRLRRSNKRLEQIPLHGTAQPRLRYAFNNRPHNFERRRSSVNILQPPTDSLYKFMAVSGLLIICFSVIWPELRIYELEQQSIQLKGEVNILRIETNNLNKDVERHNKDKSIETLIEKQRLQEIKLEQLKTKAELGQLAVTNTRRMNRILYIGAALGLTLSFFGFILWYWRVQIWQDKAIRKEATPQANNLQRKKPYKESNSENK